jgi:hypothetical protein
VSCDDGDEYRPNAMDADDEADIIAALEGVTGNSPAVLTPQRWSGGTHTTFREIFAGNVEFRLESGWTIDVFNDCNDWDYIDTVIAPEGTRWSFDELSNRVRYWRPDTAVQRQGWSDAFGRPQPLTVSKLTQAARMLSEMIAARWRA